MKKIKYIFVIVLMLIVFSFIGESYIYYLENFNDDFYSTTMSKPDHKSDIEMKVDIEKSARDNDVDVFVVKKDIKSNIDVDLSIYGTTGVQKKLEDNLSMYEEKYNSMFLGNVTINYNNINEITIMNDFNDYYLIGSKKNVKAFKVELINIYGGNHPVQGMDIKQSSRNILFVWLIIYIVILLFTYHDIIFQKKELLIKVTFGEKISKLVLKNILLDLIVFISVFIATYYFTSLFTQSKFHFIYSLLVFAGFILINSLLYLSLYSLNIKEVFSNSKHSTKLLAINYGLKTLTILLAIIVLSGSIGLIVEGLTFHKQKEFFESHKDYSYVQFDYKLRSALQEDLDLIDQGANVREGFYKEHFDNAIQLVNITSNLDLSVPTILANRNALNYLESKIPKLKELEFEEKVYYILPEKHAKNKSALTTIQEIYASYHNDFGKLITDYEIIVYNSDADIISIDELDYLNRSTLQYNPIIVFDNTDGKDIVLTTVTSLRKTYYAHDIMYLISDEKFNSFVEKNNLTNEITVKTNVYDLYLYYWTLIKRGIIIAIVLFALVLLLEVIIIGLILRLEYEINAVELSIKKILGYTTWQKNKKIIYLTLSVTIISILISLVINYIFSISEASYLFYGGVIILITETMFIFVNITKIEKTKLQKILKGGSL